MADNKLKPIIIGISGEPASGKSTLANTIEENVKNITNNKSGLITVINCDNYYIDITSKRKLYKNYGEFLNSGYDPHNPSAQDLDLLAQNLNSLKNGKSTLIPEYLFGIGQSIPEKIIKQPARVIIYEGIFALNPKLENICDVKIYVETPKPLIVKRSIERGLSRGNDENTSRKLLFDLENSTQKYIRSAKDDADIMLSGQSEIKSINTVINEVFTALK